jgi:hypothetical protein
MDKELRAELGKLVSTIGYNIHKHQETVENENLYIDQAHSAILTLFKQEMLRLIGDNEYDPTLSCQPDYPDDYNRGKIRGYNQAKAELRNALNIEGER